jgi:lycopene beta-cyclase
MKEVILILLLSVTLGFRLQRIPDVMRGSRSNILKMIGEGNLNVDVAVIGGGIAGSSISWILQEKEKCTVALIDPRVDTPGTWYPNYGEWRAEWHHLSDRLSLPELKDCTTTEWETTDCFFGGSFDIPKDERTTLARPYVRVDRIKMQALLKDRFISSGGLTVKSKLSASRISDNLFDNNLVHHSEGSTLTLSDGSVLYCKVLIDATGLESRLIGKEDPMLARGGDKVLPTGFQIAYGFIAMIDKLESYDKKAMTLFDYRTEAFSHDPEWLKEVEDKPTFMYAMPLSTMNNGSQRVFFEETSLVGRGNRRLTFTECKKRAYQRLKHLGITVLGVEEEEYCYIPMGGELPDLTQRVVGFGGAANMVHPATGYHACRMLAASTDVATAIGLGIHGKQSPDEISAAAYKAIWSSQNRGQRDFQAYGGDFLMEQTVEKLRGFFKAFFEVDEAVWSGFLAGWPGLPGNIHHETWDNRLKFCLNLFIKMEPAVRLAMVLYSIQYTAKYGPGTLIR